MRIGQKREEEVRAAAAKGAMARSPSRESVATDLSLLSLSSLGGTEAGRSLRVPVAAAVAAAAAVRDRGPSPCSDSETEERMRRAVSPVPAMMMMSASSLQLPGSGSCRRSVAVAVRVGETLFEEESELIRSCGLLSKALGLRRSFSTSDIGQDAACGLSSFASEVALSAAAAAATAAVVGAGLDMGMGLDLGQLTGGRRDLCERLDYASRSCSTWVAVGDMASASQLPSPQGREPQSSLDPTAPTPPLFSAADLVRSMNKKVRQGYIKRRLLTTYKALQRMSQQQQNSEEAQSASRARVSREILKLLRKDLDSQGVASCNLLGVAAAVTNLSLTAKDVEREKGKALTKYERNMMIFRWLHSLDDVPPGVTLDLLS